MIAFMRRALLLSLVFATLYAAPAFGQSMSQDTVAASDTTLISEALNDYEDRLRYTLIIDPFALYSRTYGFGIAANVTAYNLLWAGSRWRISARPSQRRGLYSLSLRTHDPSESNVYGLLHATYEANSAYRYYGIGQSTLFDNLVMVEKDYTEAVARIGFEFLDDRLTIQPMVGYLWSEAGIDGTIDSTFFSLDERSRQALLYAIGLPIPGYDDPDAVHQGLRFGVDAALDYRDRKAYPRSGFLLQASWERYESITDQEVSFDRLDARAHGFLSVFGSHVVALRAMVQTTEDHGNDPIPFYLYPKLDFTKLGGLRNQRHVNSDLVNVSAEYRLPLINLVDLYQASAFVHAGAGGVYDDVWSDFETELTFARDLPAGSNALRPGFGLGLRISGLEQQVDYIEWQLGFGPEGFTLMSFYFVVEIGGVR
jgi:outer membrane protein assembly factor BamA